MLNCPLELRNHYRTGNVIPFIGAGVSISVEWKENGNVKRGPSWRELVDVAIKQLGFQPLDLARVRGTDLQILEYFKLVQANLAPLTNWLVLNLNAPDSALKSSAIHTELAALDRVRLFYTTNFDNFLERGLDLHGRQCKVVAIEEHMGQCSPDVCEVLKFHGDLNHPTEMVLSESHYEKRLKLETPMDYRLRADMLGRTLLFLGYSFRDPNVSYLFRLINEEFKGLPGSATGRRGYIAVSDPSAFEIKLFRERNIEVIPINGVSQTQGIADLLKAMRS